MTRLEKALRQAERHKPVEWRVGTWSYDFWDDVPWLMLVALVAFLAMVVPVFTLLWFDPISQREDMMRLAHRVWVGIPVSGLTFLVVTRWLRRADGEPSPCRVPQPRVIALNPQTMDDRLHACVARWTRDRPQPFLTRYEAGLLLSVAREQHCNTMQSPHTIAQRTNQGLS